MSRIGIFLRLVPDRDASASLSGTAGRSRCGRQGVVVREAEGAKADFIIIRIQTKRQMCYNNVKRFCISEDIHGYDRTSIKRNSKVLFGQRTSERS